MKRNVWWRLMMLAVILPLEPVFATRYYLNADAAPGNNGTTWALAFDSIDDVALSAGDELWIAGGTTANYVLTGPPLTVPTGAKVYGGFPPLGDPGFEYRNLPSYPTIIDVNGNSTGIEVATNATQFTRIEGLTIQGAIDWGIKNGSGSKAAFDSLILKNNGNNFGASGAFQNGAEFSFPIITNCRFESNTSGASGAAIVNTTKSSFLVERCVFVGNIALNGGAISTSGLETFCGSSCAPTLPPCESPCEPESQSFPVVRLCVFESNATDPSFGSAGGAIYINGDLKVLASLFRTNSARNDGGAIVMSAGRLILEDDSFIENTAGGTGGAIDVVRGCHLTIDSCLFAKNIADSVGGAIHAIAMNRVQIRNATVTENNGYITAGIYVEADADPCHSNLTNLATVENSIIWHNGCDDVEAICTNVTLQINISASGSGALIDYSDITNLPSSPAYPYGSHNIGDNPGDDPAFIDPANLNYRLKLTSPCIDRANGTVIPQDGDDADGDSRTACDGCAIEDSGEHIPDLDLSRRLIDVPAVSDSNGLAPLDECPLECDLVPDMGAYERVACVDTEDCATPGGLNGDTVVNGLDIQPFTWCAVYQSHAELPCLCADFSGPTGVPDSVVNVFDIPCFIELLLTTHHGCPGPIICSSESFVLTDCNSNDIPDANDIAFGTSLDCNKNGVPDECDISSESSVDVNSNDIPDECETDCDGDTIPDAWAVAEELVADINENGVPDACDPDCDHDDQPDDYEIAHGAADCNANGVPDSCEVAMDCNSNGVPDDCDINPLDPDGNSSVSEDCNGNGIPDECDLTRSILHSFDCNDNNVPDECDIANETSEDTNENGIPDECEESHRGGSEGGGEFDEAAAWELFYEWYEEQVNGTPGDWGPLSGPDRFERVMDELELLGLPYARPW